MWLFFGYLFHQLPLHFSQLYFRFPVQGTRISRTKRKPSKCIEKIPELFKIPERQTRNVAHCAKTTVELTLKYYFKIITEKMF